MKRFLAFSCSIALLAGCTPSAPTPVDSDASSSAASTDASSASSSEDLADVPEADGNLDDIQRAYGFVLSAKEKAFLAQNKFLLKNVTETSITPTSGDATREFHDLYMVVRGPTDALDRSPANTVLYTSDVFLNTFNVLFTELMKEMENKTFYPAMKDLSATFFAAAQEKMTSAPAAEKEKWRSVRDYFAVPYAIFSTALPLQRTQDIQLPDGTWDYAPAYKDMSAEDKDADSVEKVIAFAKGLKLDASSESDVLADINQIFKAEGKAKPTVFKSEFEAYARDMDVDFSVDFTQFTPRSHYTGTSLRRQYFRGMNWYIQMPFFMKSKDLTTYAFAIAQLMAEHPEQSQNYDKLESMINFLVGTSDDLMPADYLAALAAAKGKKDQEAAVMEYLVKAKNPKIKSLPATYPDVGAQDIDEVLLKTKGMRLFSGKFIIDSYWTGMLTQGDEAPRPGYTQKLPPMASSLEVMGLLGSDYAKSKIPTLDFYKPENAKAIDQMMAQLATEKESLGKDYWESSVYGSSLKILQDMFAWEKTNVKKLPGFMQSPLWPMKTLRTASAFWTEMRHAVLLYAKQSFAELGGGPSCDPRKFPEPPKGYIEPYTQMYGQLLTLATTLRTGIEKQNPNLQNLYYLKAYEELMQKVQSIAEREFANKASPKETIVEHKDEWEPGTICTWYEITQSDWEEIRNLVEGIGAALPKPTDMPILSAKDKRAALLADVHTGGDSANPTKILYEGTGAPSLIIVDVSDANGQRYAVGFTYSHYEFTKEYGGQRMTDEDWQKNFYTAGEEYEPYLYIDAAKWPATPKWYDAILKL